MHQQGAPKPFAVEVEPFVLRAKLRHGADPHRPGFFIENTFNCPTLAEAHKIAGLDTRKRMTHPEMQADAISTMVAETPTDATVATA